MILEYKCKDDPEANGRIPAQGDQRFTLTFPLENGDDLKVHMGREGLNHFADFLGSLVIDEEAERSR